MHFTKEQILAINPDFQKLIDVVVINNTSKTYDYWYELWEHTIKPMNDQFKICGYASKHQELSGEDAYDSMVRILESITTLK